MGGSLGPEALRALEGDGLGCRRPRNSARAGKSLPAPLAQWRALRRKIRSCIEREGVDRETGAFVRAFGSKKLDASCLLIPIVGFLPWEDPRCKATVERIEKELSTDGLVRRYLTEDGFSGGEGAFLICSFWLVECLAQMHEERARDLFEYLLDFTNDVGLLSEQVNPENGELLGNFPQGFSHLGLIGAASALGASSEATLSSSSPEPRS